MIKLEIQARTKFLLRSLLTPSRLQYLRVVKLMVRRELQVKYRGTIFGYLWSMLNPLLFMTIVSLVFKQMMKSIPNYHLYVLAGILCWNLSTTAIIGGTHSIVGGGHLLRKIKMPIWVFPVVPLASGCVNFVLALIPFLVIFFASGEGLGAGVLFLPAVLFLFTLFLLGISLSLSTLNVFFKDVGHVLEPVLQLVFYGTPIIYDLSNPNIPEIARNLLLLNPFTHFVQSMRGCLIYGTSPNLNEMATMLGFSALSLGLGLIIYKKYKNKIIFNI